MNYKLLFVTFVPVLITACSSHTKVTSQNTTTTLGYKQYKVDSSIKKDATILSFLRPYSEEVNKQMSVVIGETETSLELKAPEGTLGNFVTDAMKQMATASYKKRVDIAFINPGGLRVEKISTGPIVLGKMYELMPFDNILVLMQLNGVELSQLLNVIASNNGLPVSGIMMQIQGGKVKNATINGRTIVNDSTYVVATSDYTAKGNEGFELLRNFKQENNGYFLRDALIDYVRLHTQQGKKIKASIEGRITNDE